MNHLITLDVETTGLPLRRNIHPAKDTTHNWNNARVIEICYIISDKETGDCVKEVCHIIRPHGEFDLSAESVKIHGITHEQVSKGVHITDVFTELNKDIAEFGVDLFVSHNIEFDCNALLSEIYRLPGNLHKGVLDILKCTERYCTMKNSRDILKLRPIRYGEYKYPKLEELCRYFEVHVNTGSLHSALYDSHMALNCYLKLKNLPIKTQSTSVPKPDVPMKSNIETKLVSKPQKDKKEAPIEIKLISEPRKDKKEAPIGTVAFGLFRKREFENTKQELTKNQKIDPVVTHPKIKYADVMRELGKRWRVLKVNKSEEYTSLYTEAESYKKDSPNQQETSTNPATAASPTRPQAQLPIPSL